MILTSFPCVAVEARLMPRSMMRFGVVQGLISTYIHENFDRLEIGAELEGWREIYALANSLDRLEVTESCELKATLLHTAFVADFVSTYSESRNVSRSREMPDRCPRLSAVLAKQRRRVCGHYGRFVSSELLVAKTAHVLALSVQMRMTTKQTSWLLRCGSCHPVKWMVCGPGKKGGSSPMVLKRAQHFPV